MPFTTEKDGEQITVYTQKELDTEVAGLKVTLGQLKDEKAELKTKLGESETAKLTAEEATATATGDKDALQRISDEREAKTRGENEALSNLIKSEKNDNFINGIVNKYGAGGASNEDLRDLLKSRFDFNYDITTHKQTVSGADVANEADLIKAITDSGRYDSYLAGTGSTGGDSQGSNSTGRATKKLSEMTATEESIFARDNPEQYNQMIKS